MGATVPTRQLAIGFLITGLIALASPGSAEELAPYILSQGVQEVAAKYHVFAELMKLPPKFRPRYQDVLTFGDLVAKARAQARGVGQPSNDDYFVALAWTCLIPWSPPKPVAISPETRERLNLLLADAYVSPSERKEILQSVRDPLLTLSKVEMARGSYSVMQMVYLPP